MKFDEQARFTDLACSFAQKSPIAARKLDENEIAKQQARWPLPALRTREQRFR
jgi:hypothetical protein